MVAVVTVVKEGAAVVIIGAVTGVVVGGVIEVTTFETVDVGGMMTF